MDERLDDPFPPDLGPLPELSSVPGTAESLTLNQSYLGPMLFLPPSKCLDGSSGSAPRPFVERDVETRGRSIPPPARSLSPGSPLITTFSFSPLASVSYEEFRTEYELLDLLNRGTYSLVRKARVRSTDELVAVKVSFLAKGRLRNPSFALRPAI